jgi:AAA domain
MSNDDENGGEVPPWQGLDEPSSGFDDLKKKRYELKSADREADQRLDAEAAALVAEPRVRRTAADFTAIPQPQAVMSKVLPVGAVLLGGPDSAGKSLLARDWAQCVASGASWRGYEVARVRPVLYVMDEGHHDFADRWSAMPLWEASKDNIYVLGDPVNLLSEADVGDIIDEYADITPGLVIFDTIYGMGMPDDMGVKEVTPVIASLKRLAQSWACSALAIGHSGHNGARRFRGSSMWRQRTDVEWHMADLLLSCERSKIADKRALGCPYELAYPSIRFLGAGETVAREAQRRMAVQADLRAHPNEKDSPRAKRLAPDLGVSPRTVVRMLSDARKANEQQEV